MDSRGFGSKTEVKVKWKDWSREPEWIRLENNPELKKYLNKNTANPYSSTLAIKHINATNVCMNQEVLGLRQLIFDALDGRRGSQPTVSVTLMFCKKTFDSCFRRLGVPGIPRLDSGNVSAYITGEEMTQAIGTGWSV